ncbi:hypothetical protein H9L10_13430 [Phycicoccus endophyticus]|uniref:Lipoprotein n=1 Tax=Phycicoccus endophyticus TaxID=1690220 RepID=A0A7G9R0T5_9MICO|nr:hypothetical protein [Phycicoccus endophyticus]NHI19500.1 hypothetical protein [Phycicoccus endophyticus]QNN49210.1 hypothetical protein H9L10_13430 [Phycicoccus endophyticus]GGL39638.1 hypothetical protein GCM10012283_22710 [Phycicoccus endophyticus]
MTTPTPRRRLAAVTLVAGLAAVALGGCSGDDPQPSPSSETGSAATTSSESSTPSPSFTPRDLSSTVLDARLPAVQGSTKGTLDTGPATLRVAEVLAGEGDTRLTFWYTGPDKLLVRRGNLGWASWPTLVDRRSKKVYAPLTYVDYDGKTRCLCTDAAYVNGDPQPRTALYPPLPADLSRVQVRQEGFKKPVSVEVTRP